MEKLKIQHIKLSKHHDQDITFAEPHGACVFIYILSMYWSIHYEGIHILYMTPLCIFSGTIGDDADV